MQLSRLRTNFVLPRDQEIVILRMGLLLFTAGQYKDGLHGA